MGTPSLENTTLSSEWMEGQGGLSPHLIASFYEVAKIGDGKDARWDRINGERGTDPVTVKAPLTEATMEMVLNWQSPFESAGPETKAPALFAMLQAGAIQPFVDAINPWSKNKQVGVDKEALSKSDAFLKQFEGRTGITKLNSTQVFNGMPPVKITVTVLFRAWSDPVSEVEKPFDKLMEWALPVYLETDSTILTRAAGAAKGHMGYVEALMPSKSPTRIAMTYKGRIYSPLVIESIGMPMSSPVDKKGRFVELLVPMTLCSLTAIDRADWSNSRQTKL